MFDVRFIERVLPALLDGLWITLAIAFLAFAIAVPWGLCAAILHRRGGLAAALTGGYVQLVRNTPVLIQLYLVYYGLPMAGIMLSAFACGVLVLAFQTGGYAAEIFRGSLASISVRQFEAASALGMAPFARWRHVILPQLFLRSLPALTNQAATIIKDTAQVGVIAVMDMNKVGQIWLEKSGNPFDVFIALAAVYLVVTTVVGLAGRLIERRLSFVQ